MATSSSSSSKKADLVAIFSGGCTYALDAIVTHGTRSMPVHQALQAAEADKCRHYRVAPTGAALPRMRTFDFANLIMRGIATKSAVAEGVPWQMAIGKSR
eukprot:4210038-Amphidinium_carterae.1